MKSKYEPLFDKVVLPNGVELRNRFVLAPLTHISSNDDGTISDIELPYIEKRSQDVGITINAAVMSEKHFQDSHQSRMTVILKD